MQGTRKKIALGLGCILTIGALAGCGTSAGTAERTIVVSATGQASASPDMGYVTYQAVSYTHLDVYKRQVPILLTMSTSSYTGILHSHGSIIQQLDGVENKR